MRTLNLRILSRVENTNITPKTFNIYLNCAAKQCNTPTPNGSHSRFKGWRKCMDCPACDLYVIINSRRDGKPVKQSKYTFENYNKLFDSILDGTIAQSFLEAKKQ